MVFTKKFSNAPVVASQPCSPAWPLHFKIASVTYVVAMLRESLTTLYHKSGCILKCKQTCQLASYPGSQVGAEREPGTSQLAIAHTSTS